MLVTLWCKRVDFWVNFKWNYFHWFSLKQSISTLWFIQNYISVLTFQSSMLFDIWLGGDFDRQITYFQPVLGWFPWTNIWVRVPITSAEEYYSIKSNWWNQKSEFLQTWFVTKSILELRDDWLVWIFGWTVITHMFARVTSLSNSWTFWALEAAGISTSNFGNLMTDPACSDMKHNKNNATFSFNWINKATYF